MLRSTRLFLLLCFVTLVLADQFSSYAKATTGTTTTNTTATCCSKCAELNNNASAGDFGKVLIQVMSLIYTQAPNITSSRFLYALSKLPIQYSTYLFSALKNIDNLTKLGLAQCSLDVSLTGEVPYSQFDNLTVMLHMDVLNASTANRNDLSYNHRQAFLKIFRRLEQIHRDMGSPPPWQRYFMTFTSSVLMTEPIWLRNQFTYSISSPKSACTSFLMTSNCQLYDSLTSVPTITTPVNQLQVSSTQVSSIPFFSSLNRNLATQTVNTSSVGFDRYDISVEDNIYGSTSDYLNLIQALNLTADVELPNDSGAFAIGETVQMIWATLTSKIFAPYLYCRYSDIISAFVASSCPINCKQTC